MADALAASAAWKATWDAVVKPAINALNELIDKDEPPEHLVHFTDAGGFLGITSGKNLRLGRALASNDPKELKHGIRLAQAEVIRRTRGDVGLAALGREMLLSLAGKRSDGGKAFMIDPHVCCFTSDDSVKRIGHWAMYGRSGAGFALRFRTDGLADGPGVTGAKGAFAKVMYKLSDQKERTKYLVQFAIQKCIETGEYVRDNYPNHDDWAVNFAVRVSSAMGRLMVAHAATLKAPEFTAEKEWRLVNIGVEAVAGSIPAGPLVRTYYETPFDPDVLETVFVGRAQAQINQEVAARLLNERGFSKTNVKRGKVELRILA